VEVGDWLGMELGVDDTEVGVGVGVDVVS
jgi:hypothetical protein